jgi:hypothetical protein
MPKKNVFTVREVYRIKVYDPDMGNSLVEGEDLSTNWKFEYYYDKEFAARIYDAQVCEGEIEALKAHEDPDTCEVFVDMNGTLVQVQVY